MKNLTGKKVAIITENGFEEVELTSPKKALEEAGATVHIVSPQDKKVKAWNHDHWSIELPVDVSIANANPDDYDALMIPGGVINPDKMRINKNCVNFATQFMRENKPVGAICHGPQLLIETGMLKGREMTSYPSVRTDLENAGIGSGIMVTPPQAGVAGGGFIASAYLSTIGTITYVFHGPTTGGDQVFRTTWLN